MARKPVISPAISAPIADASPAIFADLPAERRPFDAGLNAAILAITARLFPCGFDVAVDAPSSYKALCRLLNDTGRMVVSSDGLDGSIYGCREVNAAFRAWHDFHHWRGGFNFSPEGEAATVERQCADLETLFGKSATVARWQELLRADVNGQAAYYQRHRAFVNDQRGFVSAYLADAAGALARVW